MAEQILVGDRIRARDNDYRRGGDPLPESGIVTNIVGGGNVAQINWDVSPNNAVPIDELERVQADGSDPVSR